MLIRTWNVFHGNAVPPERRAFLAEMVRLASADDPDVLCLQELPAWALPRLGDWSVSLRPGVLAFPRRGVAHGQVRRLQTPVILYARIQAALENSADDHRTLHGIRRPPGR